MKKEYITVRLNDGGRSLFFNFDAEDCVVRAIAISENLDYMSTFELVQSYIKNGKTPHNAVKNTIVRKVLNDLGYIEIRKENRKTFKINELPMDRKIIIHTKKHICVFDNMVTFDLFCTKQNEPVYGYWVKK